MMKSCLKKEGTHTPAKRVWFDNLYVHEYPMILGDNPATMEGVPLTIDWEPQKERVIEIEFFELFRPARRTKKQLKFSVRRRAEIALNSGYTLHDLATATLEMSKIQRHRVHSAQRTQWEIMKEGLGRKVFAQKNPDVSFSRVPNEVPSVLSGWLHHGEQFTTSRVTNAAA